jgi:type IV pilus assembly protein PilA
MKTAHKITKAFTIIELLIAIAIIGILSAIAFPSYQNYTRKAHYVEIVQAATPYKLGIEECFQLNGDLTQCTAGKNGVPQNITPGNGAGLVNSVVVAESGKIIITPRNLYGIKAIDDYILNPTISHDVIIWSSSGGGVNQGYAY